ncbi:MAG TPA: ABC transporter permease, partial [Rhodospirillaceae bacterium]|nr:ABC transporter permease [Rhodospirillaceae bacterium]
MNDWTLIRRNLTRRRLRAALLVFSIFIAFLIFGVLGAVRHAFSGEGVQIADNRLVTVNKINFTQPLPIAYVERIRAVPGVLAASYANWFGGYYQDPKNQLFTFAVDPPSWLATHPELQMAPEQRKAWIGQRNAMVAGEKAARKWGWKIGDSVPLSSNIYSQKSNGSHSWDFVLVGIYSVTDPNMSTDQVLFHHAYFDESVSFGRDTVGLVVINSQNPALNETVIAAIDGMFANSTAETATDTAKAFNKAFAAQFGDIALIVTLVVGAAFFAILMIVGNTMMMAVRERTREIGVMKSLGFPAHRLLFLVLGESFLLAFSGGVIGMLAAMLAVSLLGRVLGDFVQGLSITPTHLVSALALMVGLGLSTGLFPALKAMRLD